MPGAMKSSFDDAMKPTAETRGIPGLGSDPPQDRAGLAAGFLNHPSPSPVAPVTTLTTANPCEIDPSNGQNGHERLLNRLSAAVAHDPRCAEPLIRFLLNRIDPSRHRQIPTLLSALDLVQDLSGSAAKPTSLRPQESPVSLAVAFRQRFQSSPPPLPVSASVSASGPRIRPDDDDDGNSRSHKQDGRIVPCHDLSSPSPSPPPSDLSRQNEATVVSDHDDESPLASLSIPPSPSKTIQPIARILAGAPPHSSSPLESFPRSQRPSRSSLSSATALASSAPYPGPSRSAVPLPASAQTPIVVQPFEAPPLPGGQSDPDMQDSEESHADNRLPSLQHQPFALPSTTRSGLPITKLTHLLHVYATNLPPGMDEFHLRRSLRRFGKIDDLRLPKLNRNESQHAGYAYVKFATADAASSICEQSALGNVVVKGHPITVTMRREEVQHMERPTASLFLANVWDVTEADLVGVFEVFGEIERCDYLGDRGMAYIHFTDPDAARTAIMHLQGLTINSAYIRIEYARPSKQSPTPAAIGGAAAGRRNFTFPMPPPRLSPLDHGLPQSFHIPPPPPPSAAYPNHFAHPPTHSHHGYASHAHAQLPPPPPPGPLPVSHGYSLYYQQPQQHWYAHQPLEEPSYAVGSAPAQAHGHGRGASQGGGRVRGRRR